MTNIPASTMESLGINRTRVIILVIFTLCVTMSMVSLDLQEGDLLFSCSSDENAITSVTSGVEGLPIDHVAIVHRIGGEHGPLFVVEAVKPMVRITPVDTFLLSIDNHCVLVGRVNVPIDVNGSVRRCLLMVGKPYDDLFLPGDSAIYCSELVQMNYVSSEGERIFSTIPMSFHDETGCVTEYWQSFYAEHGMVVPEGVPGTNPGELSRSPLVTIIGWYPSDK